MQRPCWLSKIDIVARFEKSFAGDQSQYVGIP